MVWIWTRIEMAGRHSPPPPWWRVPLLLVSGMAGAAFMAVHFGPHPVAPAVSDVFASSQAQRFANDILKQCSLTPTLGTQLCGEAADVAVTPIHDGKDGKPGRDGLDGLNGSDGHNGKNGRDGSDAQLIILKMPDTSYGCRRQGGTELDPVFDCQPAKIITKPSSSDN